VALLLTRHDIVILVGKITEIAGLTLMITGCPWSWKVMKFRKTIFQAWKVVENSEGHGKSWKIMIMSWNFYYCTEQFCKSDTTSFIKSNYEP